MKKQWNKAYMLIEALVALGMLATCVMIYQAGTLQLLANEQENYHRIRSARVLHEELREYLKYDGALERELIYGDEVFQVFFTEDKCYGKVVSDAYELSIQMDPAGFYAD